MNHGRLFALGALFLAVAVCGLRAAETGGTPHFHIQILIVAAGEEVRNSVKEGDLWQNVHDAVLEGKADLRFAASALLAEHGFAQIDSGLVKVFDARIKGMPESKQFEITPYVEYKKNSRKFRMLLEPGVAGVLFETVLDGGETREELLGIVRIVET